MQSHSVMCSSRQGNGVGSQGHGIWDTIISRNTDLKNSGVFTVTRAIILISSLITLKYALPYKLIKYLHRNNISTHLRIHAYGRRPNEHLIYFQALEEALCGKRFLYMESIPAEENTPHPHPIESFPSRYRFKSTLLNFQPVKFSTMKCK